MLTRGLGGSAASLISRGFVSTVRSVIKGGSRFVKKGLIDLGETLKITAMLINTNGKDEDGNDLSKMESDAMLEMIGKAQYFAEIGETLADILYNK